MRHNAQTLRGPHTITARYMIGCDGSGTDFVTAAGREFAMRGQIAFPGDVIAARLCVRNYKCATETIETGAINITGFWMGLPLFDSSPPWTGRFVSPPSLVIPAFSTPSDGSQVVTNWVTDRSVLPKRGQVYGWSWGALTPGVVTIAVGATSGLAFNPGSGYTNISTAAQAGAAHTPLGGVGTTNAPKLDIRLEVIMPRMPVVINLSDSIGLGEIDTDGLECSWPHESPVGRAGLYKGFAVLNLGIGGLTAQTLAGRDPKTAWTYQRADWQTSPPDAVTLSIGTNDINSSVSAANAEASIRTIMDNIRQLAPRAKIALGGLIPRNYAPSDTRETARLAVNQWMGTLPYGASYFMDFDNAVNPIGSTPASFQVQATMNGTTAVTGISPAQPIGAVYLASGTNLPGTPPTLTITGSGTTGTLSVAATGSGTNAITLTATAVNGDPKYMSAGSPHPRKPGYGVMAERVPGFELPS